MARIRRIHSVSGPPSARCLMQDISCCCNMARIHQFYMSMMALRRNPQRTCRKEEVGGGPENATLNSTTERPVVIPAPNTPIQPATRHLIPLNANGPFRFFDLPREVRDHVYSYLVVRRGGKTPILEAKSILRGQKKRATAARTRERLNQKRALNGRRPVAPRESSTDPIVHVGIMQASQMLNYEASDHFYQNNWFGISLDTFPIASVETPSGWKHNRITKMQLELQLKDAQRMNSFVDWTTFFASFPSLRFLRIIPTFHSRYYDWAHAEFATWEGAHYIFRAFFRELMVSIPEAIDLRLGPSFDPADTMHLEGRHHVSRGLLQHMYAELGTRKDFNGRYLAVERVVDYRGQLGR